MPHLQCGRSGLQRAARCLTCSALGHACSALQEACTCTELQGACHAEREERRGTGRSHRVRSESCALTAQAELLPTLPDFPAPQFSACCTLVVATCPGPSLRDSRGRAIGRVSLIHASGRITFTFTLTFTQSVSGGRAQLIWFARQGPALKGYWVGRPGHKSLTPDGCALVLPLAERTSGVVLRIHADKPQALNPDQVDRANTAQGSLPLPSLSVES